MARIIQNIFYSLDHEHNHQNGKITGFKYQSAKDTIKWSGLKPKKYLYLLRMMLNNYINKLHNK